MCQFTSLLTEDFDFNLARVEFVSPSFSERVLNYALQLVKFHICNELLNTKLWQEDKLSSD